jgi:glycerol-3-phosphate dehydrogenase
MNLDDKILNKIKEEKISRDYKIIFDPNGLLAISGGKLTTYRKMAEDVVLKVIQGTSLWKTPLKQNYPNINSENKKLPLLNFPRAQEKTALGKSEGAHFDLLDIIGMCREQMVLTLEDLLVRRTHAYYKEVDHGLSFLDKLKSTLMTELNWTEDEWNKQIQMYKEFLDHQNQWKN